MNDTHFVSVLMSKEKKEEIWPSVMTKSHVLTKKTKTTLQIANKKFDNTTIADRLRKISWRDYINQTSVANIVKGKYPATTVL